MQDVAQLPRVAEVLATPRQRIEALNGLDCERI